jgi:putative membrane protein
MARSRQAAAGGTRPESPRPDPETSVERRLELERAMMDAERIMMQTVQTSLSLIGFGFTITEFFNMNLGGHPQPNARFVGEALLVLGLLQLALGIWTNLRYRRRLIRQIRRAGGRTGSHGAQFQDTPSYIIAALLLIVGLFSLVTAIVGRLA